MEETMWKKLMRLNSPDILNKLSLYYKNFLPMEVRYHFAEFLENRIPRLLCFDSSNSEYEMNTRQFQHDLVTEMMQRVKQMLSDDLVPAKTRIVEAAKRFQLMNSIELFSLLAEILRQECQLLYDFENGNYSSYVSGSRDVDGKIERLKENWSLFEINDMAKWIKSYYDYQEEFYVKNGDDFLEIDLHMSSMSYLDEKLKKFQPNLNEKLENITHDSELIINTIINDYIKLWKYNQQKYGNNDFNVSGADIVKLESWCCELGKILFNLKDSYETLKKHYIQLNYDNENLLFQSQVVLNLITELISNAFIVEHQPPQVIKTNTRFSATVRLLIGDALNNKISNAFVKASIVSESQARCLNNNIELSCGELANNQVNLELNGTSKEFIASFRNMLLKNFKRNGRKSCEIVTDEKFAIVFKATLDLRGKQLQQNILTSPLVVIVHGSQEISALATVMWDNSFAKIDRQLFVVSETIIWKDFAEALNYKFLLATGRGLTQENLHFLAEKLYGERVPFPVPADNLVTWTAFCKERLSNRDFTFWEWFYAALKLTKDHLKNAWFESKIIGFVDKKKAEEYLLSTAHGTFILRFSDSEIGALSIAWLNVNALDEFQRPKVFHIKPINSKEFEIIFLNQRLNDVDELVYLYPNIPKAAAFKIDESSYNSNDYYVSFRTCMRIRH